MKMIKNRLIGAQKYQIHTEKSSFTLTYDQGFLEYCRTVINQ